VVEVGEVLLRALVDKVVVEVEGEMLEVEQQEILLQLYLGKDILAHPFPAVQDLLVQVLEVEVLEELEVPLQVPLFQDLEVLEELLPNFHLLLLENQYQHQFFHLGNH
jgi:hypothetical protein